jgi:chorismate--pyruvate lyase
MVSIDASGAAVAAGPSDSSEARSGDGLAERHFTHMRAGSVELARVEVDALDGFLRGLLFTDGTVTRALEVETLEPVVVEVIEQSASTLPAGVAGHLDSSDGAGCVRRRVRIATARCTAAVWAESYILPDRLPPGFRGSLEGTAHGIGGSIQQLMLESRRELLWFGLGAAPAWAAAEPAATPAIVRQYRIVTGALPALLIAESFAVEVRDGRYQLAESA